MPSILLYAQYIIISLDCQWRVIKDETALGVLEEVDRYVDWDGRPVNYMPYSNLINTRNAITNPESPMTVDNINKKDSGEYNSNSNVNFNSQGNNDTSSAAPSIAVVPSYPGSRNLQPFETRKLDESTVAEYTYESFVFGWCVISAVTKIIFLQDDFKPSFSSSAHLQELVYYYHYYYQLYLHLFFEKS